MPEVDLRFPFRFPVAEFKGEIADETGASVLGSLNGDVVAKKTGLSGLFTKLNDLGNLKEIVTDDGITVTPFDQNVAKLDHASVFKILQVPQSGSLTNIPGSINLHLYAKKNVDGNGTVTFTDFKTNILNNGVDQPVLPAGAFYLFGPYNSSIENGSSTSMAFGITMGTGGTTYNLGLPGGSDVPGSNAMMIVKKV